MKLITSVWILFIGLFGSPICLAQDFTYQGSLQENGAPASGAFDLAFKLFDTASGGTQVGSTVNQNGVNVIKGLFTVELNLGAGAFTGADRFLEISVNGTNLTPREKITRAPMAILADNSLAINGRAVSGTSPVSGQVLKWNGSQWAPGADLSTSFWQQNGSSIGYTAGNVGIGTISPTKTLHVRALGPVMSLQDTASAASQAGYVSYRNNSDVETAWVGFGTAGSPDFSIVNARSGGDIVFTSFGGSISVPSSNVGIGDSSPAYPLTVKSSSFDTAIYGQQFASSGNTISIYGFNNSTSGRGVQGYAVASSGSTYGVFGLVESPDGAGVRGHNSATTGLGIGVYGYTFSNEGIGVYGYAPRVSGTTYGVYGESDSPSGYGVYSDGRFASTGTKSFQIDHPLDPANKYLNHFCAEGPEPYNLYRGNVVTDVKGYATVPLPSYFDSINRDPTYQLTVIGQFAQAIVASEIANNQFVIQTDKPNVKVSWEVKAIRNDRWVQQYAFETEQNKPAEHHGKYLRPELYDEPREKGIFFRPAPARPN
jgi:hypothetical protein